jgi:aldose 1-epimerase
MEAVIELAAGAGRAVICPGIGGALVNYRWHGLDMMRRTPAEALAEKRVRLMACYPLVPYSNRIANAKLIAPDGTHSLRPNFAPEPHALHGVGWLRGWQVARTSASVAELSLVHAPDAGWPFAFRATQTYRLAADHLEITLELTNTDTRAMPAGLGFHPFFPIREGLHLQTRWQGMWEMGEDKLPARLVPPPPEADFSELRPVAPWKVDNVFTGWQREALLDYGTWKLCLQASDTLPFAVCFAPHDGRNFVAIEPVSHVINAFALAAKGTPDTGARVLAPSSTLLASVRISLSGRPAA